MIEAAVTTGELPVDDEHLLANAALTENAKKRLTHSFGARNAVRVDVRDKRGVAGSTSSC